MCVLCLEGLDNYVGIVLCCNATCIVYYYSVVMNIKPLHLFIFIYEWNDSMIEPGSSQDIEYTKH